LKLHTFLRAALLAVACVFGLPEVVAGAERPLTLEEAIALALERNEGIHSERAALAAAEAGVTEAKGAYDPLLEVDGGWRHATEPVNSTFSGTSSGEFPTTEGADAGMSVRQLLPTGGAVSVRTRVGRTTDDGSYALLSPAYETQVGVELRQPLLRDRAVDAARLSRRVAATDRERAVAALRRMITDTVAAVERAYWGLVAARLEIDVLDEAVRLAEEQLRETESRVESNVLPETEPAQPRAELERRRGELLASREALSRAENDLKLLILGDDDPLWLDRLDPTEEAALEVVPLDAAALVEGALAVRPEIQVVQSFVDRRRLEVDFARDRVLPSLDAVLSYDRFGLAGDRTPNESTVTGLEGGVGGSFSNLGDGDFDDARVALVLSFPIGNRSARGGAAVARSVLVQAEADLARVRKAVRAEVLDAVAALETATQRVEAARAGLEAAQVQLSAERDRYAVGLSTNFLVLTRQNDLSRSRLEEISALTDYRAARTEVARATGSLLADRRIDTDETAR